VKQTFWRRARAVLPLWGLLLTAGVLFPALPARAHRIERLFHVASHPVVTIHNASGKITVQSWNRPDVRVVGNHGSTKVEVEAAKKGNMVEVFTRVIADDISPAELEADYDVMVPEETHLEVHNDTGSVTVQNVIGDVTLEAINGSAEFRQIAGYVTAKTVGGSFSCIECSGRIDVNSISGNISVVRAESTDVHVRTSSGNIFLDSDLLPNGIYRLRNYSGSIVVLFSPHDSFDLSAVSIQGKVENEARIKRSRGTSRPLPPYARSLFGTYNEGRARLELMSFLGTIEIRKRPSE
jgi:DUF4097 and DUF4098 domain-containing protein YvlB